MPSTGAKINPGDVSAAVRIKHFVRERMPPSVWCWLRNAKRDVLDLPAALAFLTDGSIKVGFAERLRYLRSLKHIDRHVTCAHTNAEILAFATEIYRSKGRTNQVFVEAGCFKGGSSAKFSIACKAVGATLILCDSFEGIPSNDEQHGRTIYGEAVKFQTGSYAGALDEVRRNINAYGDISCCEFIKGYFNSTLPHLQRPLDGAYVDVDLASSTRDCIRYLYPLLKKGGRLISQDGHLPLVIAVFEDTKFWEEEVGAPKPAANGLHKKKLIFVEKP